MRLTVAEALADMAKFLRQRGIVEACDREGSIARSVLALKLAEKPGVLLRAVVEDWPIERIVRELY